MTCTLHQLDCRPMMKALHPDLTQERTWAEKVARTNPGYIVVIFDEQKCEPVESWSFPRDFTKPQPQQA